MIPQYIHLWHVDSPVLPLSNGPIPIVLRCHLPPQNIDQSQRIASLEFLCKLVCNSIRLLSIPLKLGVDFPCSVMSPLGSYVRWSDPLLSPRKPLQDVSLLSFTFPFSNAYPSCEMSPQVFYIRQADRLLLAHAFVSLLFWLTAMPYAPSLCQVSLVVAYLRQ